MPTISTRGAGSKFGFWTPNAQNQGSGDPFIASVILLAHMDGPNGSTSFEDAVGKSTLTSIGGASLSTSDPILGSASLSAMTQTAMASAVMPSAIGTSDFTIELWVNIPSQLSGPRIIYEQRGIGVENQLQVAPTIYMNNGSLTYFAAGNPRIAGGIVPTNTRVPIAVCRKAGVTRMYINNVLTGGTYADTNVYVNTTAYLGGTQVVADASMQGLVDEIRVTLAGRYDGNTYPAQTTEFPNY